MIATILGLAWTAWSWVRSSRAAQIAVLIGGVLLAIFLYGRGKKKEGAREAVREAERAAVDRMERGREVHREIECLPLSKRAERLRELDRDRS